MQAALFEVKIPEWCLCLACEALFLLAGEKCVDGRVELCAPLEEVELEHEDVAEEGAAELGDERACGCCGASCVLGQSCPTTVMASQWEAYR